MILRILAAISVRQTYVEKPEEFCVFLISKYCGMYGITAPQIIPVEAKKEVTEVKEILRVNQAISDEASPSPTTGSEAVKASAVMVFIKLWLELLD